MWPWSAAASSTTGRAASGAPASRTECARRSRWQRASDAEHTCHDRAGARRAGGEERQRHAQRAGGPQRLPRPVCALHPGGILLQDLHVAGLAHVRTAHQSHGGTGQGRPGLGLACISDQINHHCDVLVVGAGPAGLAAARLAASAGLSVTLVDDQRTPGGSLGHRTGEIDGKPAAIWVEETVAELAGAGHMVLPSTTAFGIYDHNLVGLNQRHFDGRPDTLWRVRPRQIVLATGAIERPLPFANNDLPGILSADAALVYLRRHAVLVGRRVVVAANNDSAYEAAGALAEAGADVTLVDIRREGMPDTPAKVRLVKGRALASASGRLRVEGVTLDDGTRLDADCVLVSGGWTPTIHLFGQARGKLAWSEQRAAFLPGDAVDGIAVAGAASGAVSLSEVFASSAKAVASLGETIAPAPRSTGPEATAA